MIPAICSRKAFARPWAALLLAQRQYAGVNCGTVYETLPEVIRTRNTLRSHHDVYEFSLHEPELFWGPLAKSRLKWFSDFDKVMKCDMINADFQWFIGGKLNVTVNCVDRHAAATPDKIAMIWEKDEPGSHEVVTYRELQHMVCQFANLLHENDVAKGDRVAIYMPISPMAVVAMLGCARIGAVHSVVYAGFSAEALASRINDALAEVVVTADQGVRAGRTIDLKQTVDEALKKAPGVRKVFVYQRTGKKVPMVTHRDVLLEEALSHQSTRCEPAAMDSEDPLFLLYTSGSTGQPKGLVHTQAGYLLYAMLTHKLVFDYHEGDVFGCVADIGWITGHSYVVYGPLANGATTVLFESMPTYPDPGRYWDMVQRHKINQFYGAPTAIRLLLRYGDKWPQKYDLSSLHVLGSVGEPINHEAWEWYHDIIGGGKCMLVDTWWQTETGGICVSPCPADPSAIIKPAMAMRPFYGIKPALLDEEGNAFSSVSPHHLPIHSPSSSGSFCLEKPWPGIARTIFGDHDRYIRTYFRQFEGQYFTGDGAHTDEDGYFQMTGRMDDVINVSGHRLGTAEIEDVLDEHASVAESAVVGRPHEIKGQSVFAFVTLRDGVLQPEEDIVTELKGIVKNTIASYAVPDEILITPTLPKTRSGKIMRRILRNISSGETSTFGDISTLADPSAVDKLVKQYHEKIAAPSSAS